jgi:hypothetical protein
MMFKCTNIDRFYEITFILKCLRFFPVSNLIERRKKFAMMCSFYCEVHDLPPAMQAVAGGCLKSRKKTSPTVFQKGFSGLISNFKEERRNLIFKFLHKKGIVHQPRKFEVQI